MYLIVLFSSLNNTGNMSASHSAYVAHVNIQSKVAVIIVVISKGRSGRMPHAGKDIGWGGVRQHPNLESLSMASSVQRECLPRLVCVHGNMKFGDLGMGISQSLPFTSLL